MRGKANFRLWFSAVRGITPACAGKRDANGNPCDCGRDHPRVCGEKFFCRSLAAVTRGSPPRVRGKVLPRLLFLACIGITPACAGKRGHGRQSGRSAGDHPRVCGEKTIEHLHCLHGQGSPPRVRGKADLDVCPDGQCGITPACAGKRLKRSHSIGHFSCILCLFHSVLHRASVSGGSRAGPCAPPCLPAQNAVPV